MATEAIIWLVEDDRDACLAADMDDRASKSHTRDPLIEQLERWLPRASGSPTDEERS